MVHAIAYAAVAALMVTVALYGHATIVAMQKVVVPVVGALMVARRVRVRRRLRSRQSSGGEYALGGFWQTWALSAVLFAAAPISYGPDDRRLHAANLGPAVQQHGRSARRWAIGMFVGVLLPSLFGAFTALSFAEPDRLVSRRPGRPPLPPGMCCRSWSSRCWAG